MARLWHLIAIVLHVAQVNSEEEPDNDYIPDNDFEPVTLHRLIAPGEHVKREDHIQELFAPKSEAAWHYLNFTEVAPQLATVNLRHPSYRWVDLEQVEPFLIDQRLSCQENAQLGRQTQVTLRFNDTSAYEIAKAEWKSRKDLMFTLEDEYCFQADGERSVFHMNYLQAVEAYKTLYIHATPQFANFLHGDDWVDDYHLTLGPPPDGHGVRIRQDLQHLDGTGLLRKRGILDSMFPGGIHMDWSKEFANKTYGEKHMVFNSTKENRKLGGPGNFEAQLPFPDIYCLNCTLAGEFEVRVDIDFKRKRDETRVRKRDAMQQAVEDKLAKYQPQINAMLEANLARRKSELRLLRQGKVQRRFDCQMYGTCPAIPPQSPGDTKKPTQDVSEKDEDENKWDHPIRGLFGFLFGCTFDAIKDRNSDCYDEYIQDAQEIDDLKEFIRHVMQAHLENATFTAEVKKPLDVALQFEIDLDVKLRLGCGFDYIPPAMWKTSCSIEAYAGNSARTGVQVYKGDNGGHASGKPWLPKPKNGPKTPEDEGDDTGGKKPGDSNKPGDGKKPGSADGDDDKDGKNGKKPEGGSKPSGGESGEDDGKQKKKSTLGGMRTKMGGFPWEIAPLPFSVSMELASKVVVILPGMRLRIPEGRLQYDFVKMDMVENTLRPDLDYLYGDIHLEDPSIKLVTAVGMKAKIDLLPFSAAIDAAGFGQTARVATRWDIVKLEWKLNESDSSVDKHCNPCFPGTEGCYSHPGQFSIIYRIGGYISFRFLPFSFDTGWLGKLDTGPDATPGLWYSHKLYARCFEIDAGARESKSTISDFLHKILHMMQEPIAQAVERIGSWVAELGQGSGNGWDEWKQGVNQKGFPLGIDAPTGHLRPLTEVVENGTDEIEEFRYTTLSPTYTAFVTAVASSVVVLPSVAIAFTPAAVPSAAVLTVQAAKREASNPVEAPISASKSMATAVRVSPTASSDLTWPGLQAATTMIIAPRISERPAAAPDSG